MLFAGLEGQHVARFAVEIVCAAHNAAGELADMLFDQVGLNKREAKEFVDAFFDSVRDALERGEQVKLSGFGNFDLRLKNQRPGRNPKTGEEIEVNTGKTYISLIPSDGWNNVVIK